MIFLPFWARLLFSLPRHHLQRAVVPLPGNLASLTLVTHAPLPACEIHARNFSQVSFSFFFFVSVGGATHLFEVTDTLIPALTTQASTPFSSAPTHSGRTFAEWEAISTRTFDIAAAVCKSLEINTGQTEDLAELDSGLPVLALDSRYLELDSASRNAAVHFGDCQVAVTLFI
ncbi:hypothetical protein B0H14DRAFT_2792894, partial [Mycena olivaceomarginata]